MGVVSNVLRQLPGPHFGGFAVVPLAQQRNHGTAGVSGASIIDDRLKPVADFNPVFAIRWSEEK